MPADLVTETPRSYRLVRTIATGGMGQVYEAQAALAGGIERRVALKRILPEHGVDGAYRAMFLDEARIIARLSHRNIVSLIDFGVADGTEFLVLELVDGLDAGEAFRRLRHRDDYRLAWSVWVAAEAGDALAHAHAARDAEGRPLDIVHRDVSPANILVSRDGDVKLTDFGIARANGRDERTRTGVIKGKVQYMSPEQARGELVGPPSDVFSLAVTLHALHTGEPVGDAASIDASIEGPLRALLGRALDAAPSDRPSMADFAAELHALVDGPRTALAQAMREVGEETHVSAFDEALDLLLRAEGSGVDFVVEHSRVARDANTRPTSDRGKQAAAPEVSTEASSERAPVLASPARSSVRAGQLVAMFGVLALVVVVGQRALAPSREGDESPAPRAEIAPTPTSSAASGPSTGPPTGPAPSSLPTPGSPPTEGPSERRSAVVPASPEGAVSDHAEARPGRGSREHALTTTTATTATSRAPAATSETPTERAPARRSDSPSTEPLPSSPIEARTGWLRVGGAALFRGEVTVDGRRMGHAPMEHEVSAGHHVVVVSDPTDGHELSRTEVEVTDAHRRAQPLVIAR